MSRAIYLDIAQKLSSDILGGTLAPGSRLPTHRELAFELGVTPATVAKAYAHLQREGLVSATVGRGSYVIGGGSGETRSAECDLRANLPPLRHLGPQMVKALAANLDWVEPALQAGGSIASFHVNHRAQAHDWLVRRHRVPESFQPIACSSGQHALYCILMAFCKTGDTVVAEGLTFFGLAMAAETRGLRLAGVEMDGDGLIPEALEALCQREKPVALFCTPNTQSPTTASLPQERRAQIAEIARRHDLLIIEDDVYGAFADADTLPIAHFAPERTALFTSFSKSVMAGLSCGLIAAPPALAPRIAESRRVTTGAIASLNWGILASWIASGFLDDLVASNRDEIVARNAIARQVLAGVPFHGDTRCPHIWLPLMVGANANEVVSRLFALGVHVFGSNEFKVGGRYHDPALRISLSAAASRADLVRSLSIIRDFITAPDNLPLDGIR